MRGKRHDDECDCRLWTARASDDTFLPPVVPRALHHELPTPREHGTAYTKKIAEGFSTTAPHELRILWSREAQKPGTNPRRQVYHVTHTLTQKNMQSLDPDRRSVSDKIFYCN